MLGSMSNQALACPFCRTWFEGSGRSVKCPACGRRFDADTARLNTSPNVAIDSPSARPGQLAPSLPEAYESSVEDEREERIAKDSAAQQGKRRPDLRILFTILLLALIFVGPRFLDGTAIVVVIVMFFIARWLYSRWQAGSSAG